VLAQFAENIEINWHIISGRNSLEDLPPNIFGFVDGPVNYINSNNYQYPINEAWIIEEGEDGVRIYPHQLFPEE